MSNPKQRLLRNIFSNWAQMVIGAVIAFFMSPFVVHTLGKEEYGIWALVFSIIAYMNLFDLGMKQSLARYLSRYYATKNWQNLNEVISTSTFIYTLTGTAVVIISITIAYYFVDAFNVAPEYLPVMRKALIIIGINQAIAFFFMTGTAIGPFHRYDISNAIEISFTLINAAVIVYYLKQGHGIVTLAWITLITNTIRFIIRRFTQQWLVPQLRLRIRYITKSRMRELLSYGFISFLIVVAWMVIFNIDNIVIGLFITTTAVTYYSIALQIINYLRSIINAIGVPLVPAISHLDATSDQNEIGSLYIKITAYLYYLTSAICVGLMFFGGKFIYLWMGPDFTDTVKVLYILAIPAAIYLPQIMANSVLLGIGKHKSLFYVLAGEAVSNFVLSIILVQSLGIIGVALGTAIPQTIIYLFVYPYVFFRIINANLKKFYLTAARTAGLASLCTIPVALGLKYINSLAGWGGFFLDVGVMMLVTFIGFWFWVLDSDTRVRFQTKFKRASA